MREKTKKIRVFKEYFKKDCPYKTTCKHCDYYDKKHDDCKLGYEQ